jgi:heterotetrameric sarcosine oxidase delta subunit
MLLIPCPWCGPRNQIEFTYGGDATVRRPAPDAAVSREGPPRPTDQPPGGQRAERAWGDVVSREGPPRPTDQPPGGQRAERAWGDVTLAWVDYVYLRDNPCGPIDELWYHGAGCRSWLKVRRNTRTHDILGSAPPDQPIAAAETPRDGETGAGPNPHRQDAA